MPDKFILVTKHLLINKDHILMVQQTHEGETVITMTHGDDPITIDIHFEEFCERLEGRTKEKGDGHIGFR